MREEGWINEGENLKTNLESTDHAYLFVPILTWIQNAVVLDFIIDNQNQSEK